MARLTVAFITLHLAAASSSPPSSCPTSPAGQQPGHVLLQKHQTSERRSLKTEDAASSSKHKLGAFACPWSATTDVDYQLQCGDGTLCNGWSCCVDHGWRGKCPPNRPLMCKSKTCSGGLDHCCKTDCENHGGLRSCPSGKCAYRGTTEVNDLMLCADGETCTGKGCCTSKGGVSMCPPNKPLMCSNKTCGGDHCCSDDCSSLGGIRSCMPSSDMMGNSFTHYNNGVDLLLRLFFSETGKPMPVERLTKGGGDWGYHVSQVNTQGTPHNVEMSKTHSFVVVQEQSHIPGTCCYSNPVDPEFQESLLNLIQLDGKIAQTGAVTVLYQTWGWRDGHRSRSYLETFEKFNAEVAKGYKVYNETLTNLGRPPVLAPVGAAFKLLYDAGHDEGSLFYRLYNEDARHPSELGTYLAGCVLFSSMTRESCLGLPSAGLPADEVAALQAAADTVSFPTVTA